MFRGRPRYPAHPSVCTTDSPSRAGPGTLPTRRCAQPIALRGQAPVPGRCAPGSTVSSTNGSRLTSEASVSVANRIRPTALPASSAATLTRVLVDSLPAPQAFFFPAHVGFVARDRPAQLVEHRPGRLVAGEPELVLEAESTGLRRLSGPFSGGGGYCCHDDGRDRDVVASGLAEHPGRFLDEPIPVGRDMTD